MLPIRFILKLLVRLVLPNRFVRSDILTSLSLVGARYSISVCKSVHVATVLYSEFWFVRTLVSLEVTFRLISFSGCYFTSGWKTIIIIWPQIFVLRFDSAFQNQPRSLCRVYAILDSINKILVAMVTESANNHLAGAKSASASFRCFWASQPLAVIKLAQGGKLVSRTRLNRGSRQTNIWLGPWCIRCACRLSSNAHLHVLLNVVKC